MERKELEHSILLIVQNKSNCISNSLPTNEDICSSVIITCSVCYSACSKVLYFALTNKNGLSSEANVMSSTAFCGRILSALRKKIKKVERKRKTERDLYDVEVFEADRTRKQLKFISWDSVTNTMSGVITIMKGILLSLRSLGKKCFSPRKVRWRIEATFFTAIVSLHQDKVVVRQER